MDGLCAGLAVGGIITASDIDIMQLNASLPVSYSAEMYSLLLLVENVSWIIVYCVMVGSVVKKSKSSCIATNTATSVSVSHSFLTIFLA